MAALAGLITIALASATPIALAASNGQLGSCSTATARNTLTIPKRTAIAVEPMNPQEPSALRICLDEAQAAAFRAYLGGDETVALGSTSSAGVNCVKDAGARVTLVRKMTPFMAQSMTKGAVALALLGGARGCGVEGERLVDLHDGLALVFPAHVLTRFGQRCPVLAADAAWVRILSVPPQVGGSRRLTCHQSAQLWGLAIVIVRVASLFGGTVRARARHPGAGSRTSGD